MMGLAGNGGGGTNGTNGTNGTGEAIVMVHDKTKEFYKRFLNEPFPLESALPAVLDSLLNVEIARGAIRGWEEGMQVMGTTFLARRTAMNPSYYSASRDAAEDDMNVMETLLSDALTRLHRSKCCDLVSPTTGESVKMLPLERSKDVKTLRILPTRLGKTVARLGISSATSAFLLDRLSSLLPRSNRALKREQHQDEAAEGDAVSKAMMVLRAVCETPDVVRAVPQRHMEDEISRVIAAEVLPWGDRYFRANSISKAPIDWSASGVRPFALLQTAFVPFSSSSSASSLTRVPEFASDLASVLEAIKRVMPVVPEIARVVSSHQSHFTFPFTVAIVNAMRIFAAIERRREVDLNSLSSTLGGFREAVSEAAVEKEKGERPVFRVRLRRGGGGGNEKAKPKTKQTTSGSRPCWIVLATLAAEALTAQPRTTQQPAPLASSPPTKRRQNGPPPIEEGLRVVGLARLELPEEGEAVFEVPEMNNMKSAVKEARVRVYVMEETEWGTDYFCLSD